MNDASAALCLGVVGARCGQGGEAAPGPAPAGEHLHLGRGVAASDPAAHQDRCSRLRVTCHILSHVTCYVANIVNITQAVICCSTAEQVDIKQDESY